MCLLLECKTSSLYHREARTLFHCARALTAVSLAVLETLTFKAPPKMRLLQLITKAAAMAGLAAGASLQPVSNFGDNPTGLQMYLYVPDNVAPNPAIIVAVSRQKKNSIHTRILIFVLSGFKS